MTCKAVKKSGDVCGCKTSNIYCGRHKHYIDTNKSLFSDDNDIIEEPRHLTINFMSGDKIDITDNAILSSIDKIKQYITKTRETKDIVYSLFVEGEENEISVYRGECVLFCLFRELEKKHYNKYVVGAKYVNELKFLGDTFTKTTYTITKRTSCFVSVKNERTEEEHTKKIITTNNDKGEMEETLYNIYYRLRSSNFYVME